MYWYLTIHQKNTFSQKRLSLTLLNLPSFCLEAIVIIKYIYTWKFLFNILIFDRYYILGNCIHALKISNLNPQGVYLKINKLRNFSY